MVFDSGSRINRIDHCLVYWLSKSCCLIKFNNEGLSSENLKVIFNCVLYFYLYLPTWALEYSKSDGCTELCKRKYLLIQPPASAYRGFEAAVLQLRLRASTLTCRVDASFISFTHYLALLVFSFS